LKHSDQLQEQYKSDVSDKTLKALPSTFWNQKSKNMDFQR